MPIPFTRVQPPAFLETKPAPGPPKVAVCFRNLSLVVEHGGSTRNDDEETEDGKHQQSKPRRKPLRVLSNVTGSVQPGRLTLVLGRPGSGKSALMKLLAGRVPPNASLRGHVTYNGTPMDEVKPQLPQLAAFVGQQDTHLATLTVRETLEFALACTGGGSSAGPGSVERVLESLGLQRCQDTLVGDAETRGVSGGERKRVTIAELASFGSHSVVCYDEISNGLDSAATFDIVHSTRLNARARGTAVVMALLQPSPEVVELFDNVLLLHGGEVLYFGPRDQAESYFAALGVRRPPERDLADFLCDLGAREDAEASDEDDMAFLVSSNDSEAADSFQSAKQPTARALAELWRSSPLGDAMDAQARAGMQTRMWRLSGLLQSSDALRMAHVPAFRQSFMASTLTLLKREVALLRHQRVLVVSRVLLAAGVGALFGSLFLNVDLTSPQVMLGLLFAALIFLGLSQTALLPTFLDARAVFYKQRRANFFRTSSYVLATLISQVLLSVLESFVVGTVVYWMGGLFDATSWHAFMTFQLLLVLTSLLFGAFFFLLAAASPSLHVAEPVSMLSFLFLIVFAGFVVSKGAMPSYLSWLYWVDPIAWALRALAVSQYRSKELDVCVFDGVDYCKTYDGLTFGQYALKIFDVPSDNFWVPTGMCFLVALYFVNALLAYLALEFLRYDELYATAPEISKKAQPRSSSGLPRNITQLQAEDTGSTDNAVAFGNYMPHQTPGSHERQAPTDNDEAPVALLEEDSSRRRQFRRFSQPTTSNQIATPAFQVHAAPGDTVNPLYQQIVVASSIPSITPVTLAFQDLWYSVPLPKNHEKKAENTRKTLDLLCGVTGYALPGTMTALMGSSGAGKTTLMDVIAKRKSSGNVRGRILLNGHPATDLAVRRCTAYCEQMDVHSEAATFREALVFSAYLRHGQHQSGSQVSSQSSRDHVLESVNEILMLLGLDDIAEQIIRGSSMEQMKRLTIGVELAAQPSILFLDEPTSGLDARSAKLIMDGVRKVADSGRTVVCTIHQPSAEVFFLFDNLLLLQRGGKMVYFGELGHEGRSIIEYFESMPGVPKIADGYNPATWMLEVIGAGIRTTSDEVRDDYQRDATGFDFPQAYNQSELRRRFIDSQIHAIGIFEPLHGGPSASDEHENLSGGRAQTIEFSTKRAAGFTRQLKFLLERFFLIYVRTIDYTATRFATTTILAIILGFVYLDADYSSYGGVNGGLGLIFLSVAFVGVIAFASALPLAASERAAFYRERAAQTYGVGSYLIASTLIEIPFAALVAFVYTVIFFPLVGFFSGGSSGWETMATFWATNVLHILFQTFLAQLLVFALPTVQAAAMVGVLLDSLFFLLMGFNPPASRVPQGYKWLEPAIPHKYVYAVLLSSVFGECSDTQLQTVTQAFAAGNGSLEHLMNSLPLGCRVLTDAPAAVGKIPVSAYVRSMFGADHSSITTNGARFLMLLVVFRLLAGLVMRFVCHRRK